MINNFAYEFLSISCLNVQKIEKNGKKKKEEKAFFINFQVILSLFAKKFLTSDLAKKSFIITCRLEEPKALFSFSVSANDFASNQEC